MIQEHEDVVLAVDLPDHGLERGDIGTVVMCHRGGAGYEDTTANRRRLRLATIRAARKPRLDFHTS